MNVLVRYKHPTRNCWFYLRDWDVRDARLVPVGCFSHRRQFAQVFPSLAAACVCIGFLEQFGVSEYKIVKLNP